MPNDALFDWLRRTAGADVADASDLYDGKVLLDALARATGAEEARAARADEDSIQILGRQLRRAGVFDGSDALRARDARGTMRVVREIYAESLRRRVAAFAVDAARDEGARFGDATPSPSRRRDEDEDEDEDEEEEGRDLLGAFEIEGDDVDAGAFDEDVDELDLTEDWRALESPAAKSTKARVDAGFVKASDMLQELSLNALDEDVCDDFGSDAYCRGTRAASRETKTLTRTPPPVPKALRLIPSPSAKPVKWDVVFDEPKPSGRVPTWFPGRNARLMASTSSSETSPPSKPIAVSWFGERDDDGDDAASLQRAAQRRGRLASSLSPVARRGASSPERRRSDIGVAACYVPARAPSNKRLIRNALRVLVGPPDRDGYVAAVRAIDKCEFPSVVLLLKGSAEVAPRKLRGVYAVVDEDTLKRIHGSGPEYVAGSSVLASLKFDTATMSFAPLASRAITPTVAAISLTRAK